MARRIREEEEVEAERANLRGAVAAAERSIAPALSRVGTEQREVENAIPNPICLVSLFFSRNFASSRSIPNFFFLPLDP